MNESIVSAAFRIIDIAFILCIISLCSLTYHSYRDDGKKYRSIYWATGALGCCAILGILIAVLASEIAR